MGKSENSLQMNITWEQIGLLSCQAELRGRSQPSFLLVSVSVRARTQVWTAQGKKTNKNKTKTATASNNHSVSHENDINVTNHQFHSITTSGKLLVTNMEARWGEIIQLWQQLEKTHQDLRAAIISPEAKNLLKCLWAKSLTSTFQPNKVNKAQWGLRDSNIICCINIHVMTWKDNQPPLTTGKKQALTSLSNVSEVNQLTVRCCHASKQEAALQSPDRCQTHQCCFVSTRRRRSRALTGGRQLLCPHGYLLARVRRRSWIRVAVRGPDQTRLPAGSRSSSFEEGLFSSLWLFNKPETCSFGVRPASLIALIIDLWLFPLPALCNLCNLVKLSLGQWFGGLP